MHGVRERYGQKVVFTAHRRSVVDIAKKRTMYVIVQVRDNLRRFQGSGESNGRFLETTTTLDEYGAVSRIC